jgi:SanA protein
LSARLRSSGTGAAAPEAAGSAHPHRPAPPKRWPARRHWFLLLAFLALPPLLADQWIGLSGPLERDPTRLSPAPMGLVLGTAPTVAGRPNLFYRARIEAARELWASGRVERLLLSGDGYRRGYDETAAMQRDLRAAGVPGEALLCDPNGLRTRDSLWNARELFGARRLIVVSQAFHARRALFLAKHLGLEAQALAAADPHLSAWAKIRWRELGARNKAVLEVFWQALGG